MRHTPVATMGAGVARPAIVADAAVHPSAGLAGHAVASIDETRARRQLDIIATTTADFDRAGIVHWLIGGWAIDFHLGRVSRNHSDVDFALWVTDREVATRVLTRRGFRLDHSRSSDGVELFVGPVEHVGVTYIGLAADGSVVTPGFEHWPYQPRSFGDEYRSLRGVRAAVTFYDAAWVAAARGLGVPLVSADRQLVAAGLAESASAAAQRLGLNASDDPTISDPLT